MENALENDRVPAKGNNHVLIVDDEEPICEILSQYLDMKGYVVSTACCALDAVAIIKSQEIDLVLSDIKMPGMSGIELLQWIRGYNRTLPVLLSTGEPSLDSAIEGLKLGAFDYLTKPFHLEEMGEKVRRALHNKKMEEENRLFSKLVSLHGVSRILATTHDVNDLNRKVLDFAMRIASAGAGALMLIDDAGKLQTVVASDEPFGVAYFNKDIFSAVSKWVMTKEEPVTIDAGQLSREQESFPSLPDKVTSYIAFPIKTPKKVIGILHLVRFEQTDAFSHVDLEIINVLASQAGISIDNTRLYQNIRDNYLETVRAFALAVEAKDTYTHGHSENVMKYAVALAHYLCMPEEEIENIKFAGLLHDIGKIGVSEAILNKPDRLTDEEFAEIKKHPGIGAKIIADVPFLGALAPLVKYHHEFFDGLGYPEGISGTTIPLGARILSVADAYEAMTSNRPYRKALSPETAIQKLVEAKGKQFDASLVDAFVNVYRLGKL
jgi:response regulator RpfG family c-di-GMP phosphodiesterase